MGLLRARLQEIGSLALTYDETAQATAGQSTCGNGVGTSVPQGLARHWGWIHGDLTSRLGPRAPNHLEWRDRWRAVGFGWHQVERRIAAQAVLSRAGRHRRPDALAAASCGARLLGRRARPTMVLHQRVDLVQPSFSSVASVQAVRSSQGDAFHDAQEGLSPVCRAAGLRTWARPRGRWSRSRRRASRGTASPSSALTGSRRRVSRSTAL